MGDPAIWLGAASLGTNIGGQVAGGKKGGGGGGGVGGQAGGIANYIATESGLTNLIMQKDNAALAKALQLPVVQGLINELGFPVDPKLQGQLNVRFGPNVITSARSPSSGSGYFAPIRETTEQAYTTGRENILTNSPARGGLMNYLLGQNEIARSRNLAQNRMNLFGTATGLIAPQTGAAIQAGSAAGNISNAMLGLGLQGQLANAQMAAAQSQGAGQLLGLTLGSVLKNQGRNTPTGTPPFNPGAPSSGLNFGPGTSLQSFGQPV